MPPAKGGEMEIHMKKRKLFLIGILLMVILVFSILILQNANGSQNYFNAVILEVHEGTIVVEKLDDTNNKKQDANLLSMYTGPIIVNSQTSNESNKPDLNIGDKVRIVYNESSIKQEPLRIDMVFAIYMLDELVY